MNEAYGVNKVFADFKPLQESSPRESLLMKLNYLKSGIAIKMMRTRMTRLIYKLLFPLFLLNLRMAFQGIEHLFWVAIIAIAMSTLVWHYFFIGNLEDLRIDQTEVNQLISKVS